MFPIPFNFPFRKKDGSVTTIDDAITSGGGSYTLPTASANTKGGIKIGSGLEMSGETLNNTNPTPYTLPTASADTKGGVKVGSGLSIDENGVLSASGGGGGNKYVHRIHLCDTTIYTTINQEIYVDIVNGSSAPILDFSTITTFKNAILEIIKSVYGSSFTDKKYPIMMTGILQRGEHDFRQVNGLIATKNSDYYFMTLQLDTTNNTFKHGYIGYNSVVDFTLGDYSIEEIATI